MTRKQAGSRDQLVDAFVTASRALVGLAVRSVGVAPVEVTVPQHRLLVLLAARGDQTISGLAEQLGVDPSNASRLCDRLQRLGLIDRQRSESDRRAVCITLAATGRTVLDSVTAYRRSEVRRVLTGMAAEDDAEMVRALTAFSDAAEELGDADWVLG